MAIQTTNTLAKKQTKQTNKKPNKQDNYNNNKKTRKARIAYMWSFCYLVQV